LKASPVGLRKAPGQTVIHVSEVPQVGEAAFGALQQLVAWHYDPVEGIPAYDEAVSAINHHRLGGVVKAGVKHGQCVPLAVPGRPQRMPYPALHGQLGQDLPAVLDEPVERRSDEGRHGLETKLRVVVEIAEQNVGDRQAGRVGMARVEEAKSSVLV